MDEIISTLAAAGLPWQEQNGSYFFEIGRTNEWIVWLEIRDGRVAVTRQPTR